MGVTIHFKGSLNRISDMPIFCDEMEDICKDMGWHYVRIDEDLSKPNTAKLEDKGIVGHMPLKGLVITIAPGCESLIFTFDNKGRLRTPLQMTMEDIIPPDQQSVFVKTQYTSPDAHIAIIKLLRYIQKRYISNLSVTDEGEYWETGDRVLLAQKLDFIDKQIQKLAKGFSNMEFVENESPGSLADRIEALLKDIVEKR
ncbi:MAG: hypothetical protein ACLFR1_09935 [Spirochaetia bacterium]